MPYLKYIVTVIDCYGAVCAGRNFAAIQAMRESIGFTNSLIRAILAPQSLDYSYHPMLKDSIYRLCKTLIVDY